MPTCMLLHSYYVIEVQPIQFSPIPQIFSSPWVLAPPSSQHTGRGSLEFASSRAELGAVAPWSTEAQAEFFVSRWTLTVKRCLRLVSVLDWQVDRLTQSQVPSHAVRLRELSDDLIVYDELLGLVWSDASNKWFMPPLAMDPWRVGDLPY